MTFAHGRHGYSFHHCRCDVCREAHNANARDTYQARQQRIARQAAALIEQLTDGEDTTWHRRANCAGLGPDLFFPERGESTREAKAVCAGCVVKQECLTWAVRHDERWGIWGSTTERDRQSVRRQIDVRAADRWTA